MFRQTSSGPTFMQTPFDVPEDEPGLAMVVAASGLVAVGVGAAPEVANVLGSAVTGVWFPLPLPLPLSVVPSPLLTSILPPPLLLLLLFVALLFDPAPPDPVLPPPRPSPAGGGVTGTSLS